MRSQSILNLCKESIANDLIAIVEQKKDHKELPIILDRIKKLEQLDQQIMTIEIVKEMANELKIPIDKSESLLDTYKDNEPILWLAAFDDLDIIVKFLIDAKANINIRKITTGTTPLHVAAQNGHSKVVSLLLDAKADINLQDSSDRTPLQIAIDHDKEAVVTQLIKAKADINIQDNIGRNALFSASHLGNVSIVSQLLETKADVNSKNNNGRTALHQASDNGHASVISQLLNAKADIEAMDNDGYTALWLASEAGNASAVSKLIEFKANVNATNKKGATSLDMAAEQGFISVAKLLIEAGIDLESKYDSKWTALDAAMRKKHLPMVYLLLNHGAVIHHKTVLQSYLNSQDAHHPDVIFSRGVLHEQQGAEKSAIDCYENLIKLDHPAAHRRLAGIYNKNGDPKKAMEFYQKALKLNDELAVSPYLILLQKLAAPKANLKILPNKNGALVSFFNSLAKSKPEQESIISMTITSQKFHQEFTRCQNFIEKNPSVILTSEQWCLIASDVMGNPYFASRVISQNLNYARHCARKALQMAKTEKEMMEAQSTLDSVQGLHKQITTSEPALIQGAVDLIAEYSDEQDLDNLKNQLRKIF